MWSSGHREFESHPRRFDFMLTPSEEIKARLDIVEVLREYLPQMKQSGANWKARCPFHNEKTPSFMVSKEKQIWHCFGCGEGSDVFGFVMKIEGLEFPEALRLLAAKAGVKLTYQDPKLLTQRAKLLNICKIATEFFQQQLLESSQGALARQYFQKRGVAEEVIEDFQLGYSPNSWDQLLNFMSRKGFSAEDVFLAGLTVKKERGTGFFDRFRHRLMFPIRNVHADVVGFTARILEENNKEAKYVNTPQTLLYDKSAILFGLDKAKETVREKNCAILVEGNMDVLASYQAGVKNVVASSGSALTPIQIKLLKRYSPNLLLAFDADAAGDMATARGLDIALEQSMEIKIITLPAGVKDPDECVRKAPVLWEQAVEEAKPFVEYCFQKTIAGRDLNQVEQKKQTAGILLKIINKLQNRVEQSFWIKKLGEILNVPEIALWETLEKAKQRKSNAVEETEFAPIAADQNRLIGERVLAISLKFGQVFEQAINYLAPEMFTTAELRDLYKALILYYTDKRQRAPAAQENFDFSEFIGTIEADAQLKNYADILLLLAEKDFFDENGLPLGDYLIKEELIKGIKILKKNFFLRSIRQLEEEIKFLEEQVQKVGWTPEHQSQLKALNQKFIETTAQLTNLG